MVAHVISLTNCGRAHNKSPTMPSLEFYISELFAISNLLISIKGPSEYNDYTC
jgi:hypothetical protein